jgi:hypothetical protein
MATNGLQRLREWMQANGWNREHLAAELSRRGYPLKGSSLRNILQGHAPLTDRLARHLVELSAGYLQLDELVPLDTERRP